MNVQNRKRLFERLQAQNPHPQTELEYATPFELLIAVLLSAQATDKSVNQATRVLFPIANTPEALLTLGEAKLKTYLKSINLYPTKTKHILKTCELLLAHHQGQVPSNRPALEALPGVGRKTANVVLNIAFDKPTLAVDTHIFRVANRTGLAKGATPLAIEKALEKRVPKAFLQHAHHWLILHGRYVCTARKPRCTDCILNDLCEFKEKTIY